VKRRHAIVDRILTALAPIRSCCVVGHVRPDGDCVGSQLALTLALEHQRKLVHCWNHDSLPARFAFLDPERRLTRPRRGKKFDCVIAVDCASLERLGDAARAIRAGIPVLNIDHHASNTRYGTLNWVSQHQPSAGELVYQLLNQARWPLSPAIADCLYTAISTDTGSFQYPSTLPSTLQTAAELLKHGAHLARISEHVYHSFPLGRVCLVRELYRRFRLLHQSRIATFYLRRSDFQRAGADVADTDGLIDHLRSIEPVIVACLFEEAGPNLTRISLRSKDPSIDVNAIAAQFGGGGHRAAAGARIHGQAATVQRQVLSVIKQAITAGESSCRHPTQS
jgi:phosphoesterase RecJ-like protein